MSLDDSTPNLINRPADRSASVIQTAFQVIDADMVGAVNVLAETCIFSRPLPYSFLEFSTTCVCCKSVYKQSDARKIAAEQVGQSNHSTTL